MRRFGRIGAFRKMLMDSAVIIVCIFWRTIKSLFECCMAILKSVIWQNILLQQSNFSQPCILSQHSVQSIWLERMYFATYHWACWCCAVAVMVSQVHSMIWQKMCQKMRKAQRCNLLACNFKMAHIQRLNLPQSKRFVWWIVVKPTSVWIIMRCGWCLCLSRH